jgi:CheY-like chemotaxis protein
VTEPHYKLLGDGAYKGDDDPLGFHDLADGLVDLLRGAHTSTPMTLGIQAPWGMGKSSLMRQMMRLLEAEPKTFKTVWFNAWTFEGEDVLEGLIKTVLEQMDSNVLRRALRNEKFTTTFQALTRIASRWLGISDLVNEIWDAVKIDPRARNQLKDMLASAMDDWVSKVPRGSAQRSIVVFIDDLDRCSPENVFAVFEAIKLYLDATGFVFVLGVDSEIISESILEKKKYSKKITSEQYVEKIVQIAYNIPSASPQQMKDLFKAYSDESRTTELFDADSTQLVLERNNNNPRRIKRFINVFILEYQLNPDSRKLEPKLLIKIIMLGMYYRGFCRLFEPEAELDAISEFLEYQQARLAIGGLSELMPEQVETYKPVFERYALSDPLSYHTGEAAIRALDAQVPEDFVALAGRPQFIKLVASIAPEERALVAAHIKRVGEALSSEAGAGTAAAATERMRLDGINILWLDDNPANNQSYKLDFEQAGAEVQEVISASEAISQLQRDPWRFDMLISDVARGEDRTAGFNELAQIREGGGYQGPVIFFVSAVRAEDRKASQELGAQITNDPLELYDWVSKLGEIAASSKFATPEFKSSLHHKMYGLPDAEARAEDLLKHMTRSEAVERLVGDGFGRAMAESAVSSAASRYSKTATAE